MHKLFNRLFSKQKDVEYDVQLYAKSEIEDWVQVDPVTPPTYADVLKRDKHGHGVEAPVVQPPAHAIAPRKVQNKPTTAIYIQDDEDDETAFITHYDSANYSLAARSPSITFQDLRSAAHARHRHRSHLTKYFSFTHLHPGQLGAPHYTTRKPSYSYPLPTFPADLATAEIVPMSKRDFFNEAQAWPRPPRWHRGRRHVREYGWTAHGRGKKEVRKWRGFQLMDLETEGLSAEFQFLATGDPALFWRSSWVADARRYMRWKMRRDVEVEAGEIGIDEARQLSVWPVEVGECVVCADGCGCADTLNCLIAADDAAQDCGKRTPANDGWEMV